MSLLVKIKEYELIGDHIEFILEVYDKNLGENWNFHRRYSYLRDAHKQIKSLDSRVPEFPPRKMFGSKNPRFLEQRRGELEEYFNAIVKIPKILENSFVKDLLRPQDAVFTKTSPVQAVTPYKKPKKGPEMQSIVNQINEMVALKFFDLSAQPVPPDEEDIKRQMKLFEGMLKSTRLPDSGRVPEGSHINDAYCRTTVVRQVWINSAFNDLKKIAERSSAVDLLISFK